METNVLELKEEELKNRWKNLNLKIKYITAKNGDDIWDYSYREAVKSIAWMLVGFYNDKKDYYKAAWYLLHGIITPHYWRARETIENSPKYKSLLKKVKGKYYYPGYQLDIDDYTKHWLWAQEDRRDLFDKEVIENIIKNFGYEPKESKYLPKGATCYQFKD